MNQTISYGKYVLKGAIMCILCIILLIIYTGSLDDQIVHNSEYKQDECRIASIEQTRVKFNCVYDTGLVSVVDLPCVKILVNTSRSDLTKFYRNMEEKELINQNALDLKNNLNNKKKCSYIPTACENDADYMDNLIKQSYSQLFPPLDYNFLCFSAPLIQANKSTNADGAADSSIDIETSTFDALLFVPSRVVYPFSITVLCIGLVLSVVIIIHGLLNIALENTKYFRVLNGLLMRKESVSYRIRLRKILDETHIKWTDVLANEIDIYSEQIEHDFDVSTGECANESFDLSDLRKRRNDNEAGEHENEDNNEAALSNSFKSTASIDSARTKSSEFRSQKNVRMSFDHALKHTPSKIRLGDLQYFHVGRIEYKTPSMMRLSRANSVNSLYNNNNNNNNNNNQQQLHHFYDSNDSNNEENIDQDDDNRVIDEQAKFFLDQQHQGQQQQQHQQSDNDHVSIPDPILEEEDSQSFVNTIVLDEK